MNLTNFIGLLMLGGGIFNAARKAKELDKWKGYELGLLISLFLDIMLIFVGGFFVSM